tara:strand:+ start:112 stop:291 length:180 start_codon:yes stop_codon:yes gene_type:complete
MGIPDYRIATTKSLEKAKKRNRRKNAKTKDHHKTPPRKTVERRHVKLEKIMRNEWRGDI